MHPAVMEYVRRYEESSKARGTEPLNGLAIRFLEQVWGPAFDYRFEGLSAEHPFKDFSGRRRYADFRYEDGLSKTAIELDGYTTHARDITSEEFDDHVERQNDLLLNGWFLLRFTSGMVIHKPEICRRQLVQSIGAWHYLRLGGKPEEQRDQWERRKDKITRIANVRAGVVRPIDVAESLGISKQAAAAWLRRLAAEGFLEPAGGASRITFYRLRGWEG